MAKTAARPGSVGGAKTAPTRSAKGGTSAGAFEQFKSWGDQVTNDLPDLQAFLNRKVDTAPRQTSIPGGRTPGDYVGDRVVPEGLETSDLTGQKGTGYGIRFPTSGASTTFAGGADRKQSSRIIILAMGVAGAATILTPTSAYQVGNTKVPGNMRAFAGVIVAGTVALVINEISPSIGMLFGVSLIFIAIADAKVFTNFGNAIFGNASRVGTPAPQNTGGFSDAIRNGVVQNPTPNDYQGHATDPKTGLPEGWPGSTQNPLHAG